MHAEKLRWTLSNSKGSYFHINSGWEVFHSGETSIYDLGNNILELYNILVQARFPTSKTKLDI